VPPDQADFWHFFLTAGGFMWPFCPYKKDLQFFKKCLPIPGLNKPSISKQASE